MFIPVQKRGRLKEEKKKKNEPTSFPFNTKSPWTSPHYNVNGWR